MRWTAVSLAIALVCAAVNQAVAQTANQAVAQKTANQVVAQKKVALVIGNDKYANEPQLQNPGRDAGLIAAHLEKLGFELVGDRALIDLDKATTDRMVSLFVAKAQDADVSLFYFSGHGTQFNGANYLLPIDVGPDKKTIGLQALNADLVVEVMEESRARLKIVLLDACRSPFKGPGGGLNSMQAPAGTVIGFATQPNHTATQGPPGGNSPYAKALAHFMGVKGLEIFTFFNEVALEVMDATANEQEPWVSYSAIRGKAYPFYPPDVTVDAPTSPPLQGHGDERDLRTSAPLPYIQLAYKQLDNNDFAGARATLTKGIEADDGKSAVAYSYRGFAWYLEGQTFKDPESALRAYQQGFPDLDVAIKLDPSYASVRRHRGNMMVATYNARRASRLPTNDILDRAIDDLKYAERLDPTSEANSHALEDAYRLKRLGFNKVQVIEDLQLREQPDPRARNILGAPPNDRMPKGSQVALTDICLTWMGSGRGAQDADNIWCPVLYEGHRGWANAYYLAGHYGERVACVLWPPARGCASMAGR
jgi:tetratricopeptide (TPR) repeat protein